MPMSDQFGYSRPPSGDLARMMLEESLQRQKYDGMTHTGQDHVGMDTVRSAQAVPGQIVDWAQNNPMDAAFIAGSMLPFVGDAVGFAGDVMNMYNNPEERTLTNAMLAGAGALPFVPSGLGMVKRAGKEGVEEAIGRAWRSGKHTFGPDEISAAGYGIGAGDFTMFANIPLDRAAKELKRAGVDEVRVVRSPSGEVFYADAAKTDHELMKQLASGYEDRATRPLWDQGGPYKISTLENLAGREGDPYSIFRGFEGVKSPQPLPMDTASRMGK